MDTITITVAENDPDVIVSATLNEDAVTITLNEAATGATGAGVPTGGSANDILKKTSSTNYATAWETPTSAATASTIVRRNASGGAAFGGVAATELICSGEILTNAYEASIHTSGEGSSIYTNGLDSSISTGGLNSPIFTQESTSDIYTLHPSASVKSYNFAALDATVGAALRDSAGTAYLTWGATAGTISITVDTTSTGHFLSNPSTATAGHFLTKNGTTPTIAAGRSAWFSSTAGAPQFKNGTGSAVTLIYEGGALGTPSSGTLTSCTGLPISTGVSGLGTNVATFLATPSSANLLAALTTSTGTGSAVFATSPTLTTPVLGAASGTTLSLGTTLPSGTVLNSYSSGSSTGNVWRGRLTAGGDTARFLMGEINGQAWLGAHNAALNAWEDFYINPDGNKKVGIGDLGGGSGNVAVPILSIDNATGLSTFSGPLALAKTITAGGTTGAQTINKTSGSVNFAAAATSIVVTNSLCTTSSVINATMATNDATASGLRVVAGTGSFTIHMLVAPTAETRVNFVLTN